MAIWCTCAVRDDGVPYLTRAPQIRRLVEWEFKAKCIGGNMFDLGPDLPGDTLVEMVRLPSRIRNAAKFAGLKTIGDLRETTDETFASIPNLGPGSVKWLRAKLSERRRERG
jgi:DNA-directed RNA polymerase alpha subunit